MANNEIILSVKDLVVKFSLRGRILKAIREISLDLHKGESLAIVGESGSGKSVFTKTFNGMLDPNGFIEQGSITYYGKDEKGIDLVNYKTEKEWLNIRGGEIAMVFQDPMTALNPLKTIGTQICEAIMLHDKTISLQQAKLKAVEYISDVGIEDAERRSNQFPHEFSGGMRQRIVIAIAMACNPKILICDEPTTALDVTIQAQILGLLRDLKEKYDLTIVYITHDLGVVAAVADRVAVMYAGDIVEIGGVREVFYNAQHPYTWALLSSLPQLGVKGENLFAIRGTPPNLFNAVQGDAFAPRNPNALNIDFIERPPYFPVPGSDTHKAKTWLLDPRSPKIEPPAVIRTIGGGRNAN